MRKGHADVLFLFWPEKCTFYERSLALWVEGDSFFLQFTFIAINNIQLFLLIVFQFSKFIVNSVCLILSSQQNCIHTTVHRCSSLKVL
jgi:hypothetical protein